MRALLYLRTGVSNFDDNCDQGQCVCCCYFIFAARRFTCDLLQTFVDALTATK
jgi:hypothetical protein